MATLLEICSQIIIDMFSNNYWKYVLRQYIAVINSVINYFEVICYYPKFTIQKVTMN